jgi:hypothetical protein
MAAMTPRDKTPSATFLLSPRYGWEGGHKLIFPFSFLLDTIVYYSIIVVGEVSMEVL